MQAQILVLIVASVALSATAQIAFKIGMSKQPVQAAMADPSNWARLLLEIVTQPQILTGLFCYGFGTLMWLFVLARVDVSVAYPFVGLGFILTMLLGGIVLGEQIGVVRVLGTLLIVFGIVLISRS